MIYILHGEDIYSSYNRLQQILENYPSHTRIRIDEKSSTNEFSDSILTQDLLGTGKIIICENFISSKRIKLADLKSVPKEADVIFWEKAQIFSSSLTKVDKDTRIEQFKPKPALYTFLDSISLNSTASLKHLNILRTGKKISLNWHLAQRVQLLILAKLKFSREDSEKISGKSIENWQWQKIMQQANLINLTTLKKLFFGVIKIDYLIKSGKTNIDETYLISTLLVKYLRG